MSAAFLMLALAATPDGGALDAIYASCPDVGDAGLAVELDGGWYLPNPRAQRLACKLAGCESQAARLEAQPSAAPVAVVVAAALGLVVGAAAGVAMAWRFASR